MSISNATLSDFGECCKIFIQPFSLLSFIGIKNRPFTCLKLMQEEIRNLGKILTPTPSEGIRESFLVEIMQYDLK